MTDYWQQFFGSSTANIAFGALLILIIWLKRRIKISKCKTNCHWFECESQLADLHGLNASVQTQRGMIADIAHMIQGISAPNANSRENDIILRTPTPRKSRATSV